MKRVLMSIVATAAMTVFASSPLAAEEIGIVVSPNVINIASQATVVTVHTDIPFSAVEGASVTLNDIGITFWKSDNRGYFVAKFSSEEVKALDEVKAGMTVILTLSGTTTDGEEFSGMDEVKVIEVKGKK